MKMLKLTDSDGDPDVYLNPAHIVSFSRNKNGKETDILAVVANGWYSVKETPEEINRMIDDIFGVYL
jgi:hypothetical protein